MVANILAPSGRSTPEPQMVRYMRFRSAKMTKYLESGQFTDLKVICHGQIFCVHRIVVAANCPYFDDLLSKGPRKMEEVLLDDDEDPAMIARLIYFLYTGSYPARHIAHVKVKSFSEISDSYVITDCLSLLHAKMFSVGIKYRVPGLEYAASLAFRSLGHQDLCRNPDWPALADYIYTSTPSHYFDLRNIVVRELLHATHHDRARLKMQDLKDAVETTPDLAMELATTTLTNCTFRCNNCDHDQYLLVLPCSHHDSHETDSSDCFKLGLVNQECSDCHNFDVFKGAAD